MSFGKTKKGQAYPKTKKSRLVKRGSTSSQNIVIGKNEHKKNYFGKRGTGAKIYTDKEWKDSIYTDKKKYREAIIHYNIFGGIRPIMKPTLTDNIIYGLTTSSEEKAKIVGIFKK